VPGVPKQGYPLATQPRRRIFRVYPSMFRLFVSLAFTCALAPAGLATTAAALPEGTALVSPVEFAPMGDPGTFLFNRVADAAGSPVLEVTTVREISPSWAIQVAAPSLAPVAKNDTALLRFRGRVTKTLHETGQGRVRVTVQRMKGDFQRSAAAQFDLLPEWTDFQVPVRFASNYQPGEFGVYFGFGFSAQTVEIAGVSLVHYGKSVAYSDLPRSRVTYTGMAPDAPWRTAALERIEKIRKGDMAVFVTDTTGRPVPSARVSIEMRQHLFEFGTAVPFSLLMDESPQRDAYRKHLLSIFNAVGPENDLKWPAWAGDKGDNRKRTLAALHWLKDNNIPVRGHVLIWPGAKRLPASVAALIGTPRESEIPGLITAHIADIANATAGLVSEWDVLNEPFSHHQLMDLFGREIMADWFKAARQSLGPAVPLYFNDWGNHDLASDPVHTRHFIDTARFIMAHGGPINGLGLQAHIGGTPPSPESLLSTLDLYQKELGLPVRVTEFDFSIDDPQLHAAYTRDFLIAYFSHPLTAGIQFWGFWEKSHWRPEAALFNADWSERPAGTAVRTLLRETWWTNISGDTDAAGACTTRGFYGRYTIRATLGDRTIETEIRHLPGTIPTAVHLVLP
jgi:endo-1,4-beta-xylanase